MLAAAVVTSTAWAHFPDARPNATLTAPTVLAYNLTRGFCDRMRSRFFEDMLFSWRTIRCSDVHLMVRQAFDAWEHNSLVSFVETERGRADIVVIKHLLHHRALT